MLSSTYILLLRIIIEACVLRRSKEHCQMFSSKGKLACPGLWLDLYVNSGRIGNIYVRKHYIKGTEIGILCAALFHSAYQRHRPLN